MSIKGLLADLTRGIRNDVDRCSQLQPLLVEQQLLLAQTDSDGLSRVGALISGLINELEASAGERSGLMELLGLQADGEGFRTLVTKLPAPMDGQLERMWTELESRLVRCKALNERNGELLASHRHALEELMGTAASPYDGLR